MAFHLRRGKRVPMGEPDPMLDRFVEAFGPNAKVAPPSNLDPVDEPERYSSFSPGEGTAPSSWRTSADWYAVRKGPSHRTVLGLTAVQYGVLVGIMLIALAILTPLGPTVLLLGPIVAWGGWTLATRERSYRMPRPTGIAEIDLDGVPVVATVGRFTGIAEILSRGGRVTQATLVSEPDHPASPAHCAVRVDLSWGECAAEAGYLPEPVAAEVTGRLRANADQGMATVSAALIYGDPNDRRGLGVWLAGPDNPAVTKELAPVDLRPLGHKAVSVDIPRELAQFAEPADNWLLELRTSPSPGISVHYPDGRYLGELSRAQVKTLNPRLGAFGTWFAVNGTATVSENRLKAKVHVPKAAELRRNPYAPTA